ncbi:hypothetical protein FQA39_LY07672 [Lamprigera yunnana]|nr:hypothetical protein FQA39_LY07672 [Lamprigera yunnana]
MELLEEIKAKLEGFYVRSERVETKIDEFQRELNEIKEVNQQPKKENRELQQTVLKQDIRLENIEREIRKRNEFNLNIDYNYFGMTENSNVNETQDFMKSKSFRLYGTRTEPIHELDLIESTIGNFGIWQCEVSILLSLLKLPLAWVQLSIVFIAPPTEFWCKRARDESHMSTDSRPTNSDHCRMWNILNIGNQTIPCIWGYEYNRTVVNSSIITEWNLVCDHAYLVELTQMILMFGVLLGSIAIGQAADKFGRKKVLIVTMVLQTIFAFSITIVPWYAAFTFIRFLLGFVNGGTMVVSFVLCMEIVGGKWRTIVPILYQIPFGIGNSVMAALAYYLRDWRTLQLALSVLTGSYLIYIFFIPESPRWLFIEGKFKETIKLLENAATINKRDSSRIKNIVEQLFYLRKNRVKKKLGVMALVNTPEIRKRTVLLSISSVIAGLSFFSFSQYLTEICTNMYFAVFVGGLIIIPGALLCVLIVTRCGRRQSIGAACLFVAVCFFGICGFPINQYKNDWPRILLAVNGLLGMSIAYPALHLYISELYPTVIRNSGVGATVMFSKVGSIVAPLLLLTSKIAVCVPLVTLGILLILQATLVLPLPETGDSALPETISVVELQEKYYT